MQKLPVSLSLQSLRAVVCREADPPGSGYLTETLEGGHRLTRVRGRTSLGVSCIIARRRCPFCPGLPPRLDGVVVGLDPSVPFEHKTAGKSVQPLLVPDV